MAWAMPAQAQVDFGVKAGLNLTNFSINDSKVLAAENKTGFFAGVTAKVTLPVVGLGVDGSVLYDQREAKLKGPGTTLKQQSIQIPVNLRYALDLVILPISSLMPDLSLVSTSVERTIHSMKDLITSTTGALRTATSVVMSE